MFWNCCIYGQMLIYGTRSCCRRRRGLSKKLPASVSPGFLRASKLRLHQGRKPVRQRPAENHDPEGAGAALLPVRAHHYLTHPGGPGDR